MYLNAINAAFISVILSACVSSASLQTAETMRTGALRVTTGISQFETQNSKALNDRIRLSEDDGAKYLSDLRIHYGYSNELQITTLFNIPYGTGIAAKYKLCYGAVKCSVGLSLFSGIQKIFSLDGTGDNDAEVEVIDTQLPFYLSARFSWFAPYSTFKLVHRNFSGDFDASVTLFGYDLGFAFGREWGGLIEYSYIKDLGSSFDSTQLSLAFFYNIN